MGSLTSGVFSLMLGWIRTAASYLWNAAASPEGGSLLQWMADHWLTLAIILSGACVIVDTVVHLLRWRSYKVWASFFRRISGRQSATEEPQRRRRVVHRKWIYADGTARTEAVAHDELPMEEEQEPWQVAPALPDYELDQEAYRRQFARPEGQLNQSATVQTLADYPQPAPQEAEEEPVEEAVQETVRRGRRLSRETTRAAFQQLFASHDEDELDLRYRPAQPAVSKEQAYHKPYYPPQWKPPAEVGTFGKENESREDL